VTSESAAKSRKAVLRAARTAPEARIIVVGCSTAPEKKLISRIPQVVFLAGNEEKSLVGDFLNGGWKPGEPFPSREKDLFSLKVSRYADRARANVKVQDGCDSFCSFCIIPFLRGRSKSRHPDAVVEEVRRLAANGYREVVITGVHIQDYGKDLQPEVSLSSLLRRVGQVAAAERGGISRVRISSINVKAFTPELIDLFQSPIFCPHWHIPLQAGSDEVLKRMRRDYTVADFRRVVEALRERREDPAISTDVIAGHPGESEACFGETLRVCRDIGFSRMHVFPFSLREGTLAS
jgi:threonylcarbamoyladenosine tRNA methylthiotransferase MtaB